MKISKFSKLAGRIILFVCIGLMGVSIKTMAFSKFSGCQIKMGALAPLSEPGVVSVGKAMQAAMVLAERDVNASGGVLGCDLKVVLKDTKGDVEIGKTVVKDLVKVDKVIAIGGGYHSYVGNAVKSVANNLKVPVVFAGTWDDAITASKLKYVFRIAPISSWASSLLFNFVSTIPNVKKVAVVSENTDFGNMVSNFMAYGLGKHGIKSVIFTEELGAREFSETIAKIKSETPDFIKVVMSGDSGLYFAQQAVKAGLGPQNIKYLSNMIALNSEKWWEMVPEGNYAFVPRVGLPENLYNDKAIKFAVDYKKKTGKSGVESYAMEAYDSIRLLVQAINEADSKDGEAIVVALENIRYSGVLGEIYFPYGTKLDPSVEGKGNEWWHQWPDPALTIIQYQKKGEQSNLATIVYPKVYKTGNPFYTGQ